MTEKNETTIIERLKDPYSMYSFLTLISYIIMIILYFVLPVIKSYNNETKTVAYYYWNGNFQEFDLLSGDLVSTGVYETLPVDAHYILIISIFLLMALSIAQIATIIFSKKLTKKSFLNIFIIPTFLFNSLLLFGFFSFFHWIRTRSSNDLTFNMVTPLIYILFIGILLTLVVVIYAAILTIAEKRKDSRRSQLS